MLQDPEVTDAERIAELIRQAVPGERFIIRDKSGNIIYDSSPEPILAKEK